MHGTIEALWRHPVQSITRFGIYDDVVQGGTITVADGVAVSA